MEDGFLRPYVLFNTTEPFSVPFLDMLSPKDLPFEKLSTLWYFASELILVLLLDIFLKFLI